MKLDGWLRIVDHLANWDLDDPQMRVIHGPINLAIKGSVLGFLCVRGAWTKRTGRDSDTILLVRGACFFPAVVTPNTNHPRVITILMGPVMVGVWQGESQIDIEPGWTNPKRLFN